MQLDDVVLNKFDNIKRCINRINEEYIGFEEEFEKNYTKQDSVILNLERATQSAVDVATHIIRIYNLGLPKQSRDVFDFLEKANYIAPEISNKMKKMIGFRNIAVHDYQNISLDIVKNIINEHLNDFEEFMSELKDSLR